MGREVHDGRPAPGHADHIAFDGDGMRATELHALHTLGAFHIEDAAAREDGDALGAGARQDVSRDGGAMVRHRDGNARVCEVKRNLIGRIIVGGDHRALVGRHRIAIGVCAQCRGQHHAGPVIVGEHQRPFDGAGGHHDRLGAKLRQQHARLTLLRIGAEVAAVFHQNGKVAVIEALNRGAGEGLDVGKALQLLNTGNAPGLMLGIIAGQQRTAEVRILLGQYHARTAAARRQCSGKTRRARADDQHVAEGEAHVIAVRVGKVGRLAQTRRLADEGLVEHP